ncbi:tyrosine-type recombinase/integrase [uncultured Ruminococcus sp.]|jgi:site-specific recombinase XerD|uniref:tyrosine-type recombinase/integrase n=1 Tax=uncultured Ruminococcus sp. TaxID=165186 RepID=UPI0026653B9C|nr:tyrosine-type recombinase/integrase [uncultured Ruminococcus sp.]
MNLSQAYEMFMQEQKFRGNSKETISYYKICLNMFIDYCGSDLDVSDLDVILFKGYQLYLSENKDIKRVSVRTYSRAVRVFYRYLYFEDIIDININKLKLIKADKEVIMPLTDIEVKQLLNSFEPLTFLGERDKLMCMLMLDCGLRRGEVVKLKLSDIDKSKRTMIINGKGSKQRIVPFGKTVKNQLMRYLTMRSKKPCSFDSLFLTVEREPITANTIKMLFQRLKNSSGISRLYPHLLRHTFATNYIIQGGNLEVLRVLLGHSSISITQIYIHLAAQMQLVNNKFDSHLDTLT